MTSRSRRRTALLPHLASKTITTTDSGHNIYLYNPTLVTDSIDEIVDDVRTTSTATTS